MTAVTVDYVWQAIRDSERSDEFRFIDDELRIKAEAAHLAQLLRPKRAAVAARPIADAASDLAHQA
jgi:hypothetical protein